MFSTKFLQPLKRSTCMTKSNGRILFGSKYSSTQANATEPENKSFSMKEVSATEFILGFAKHHKDAFTWIDDLHKKFGSTFKVTSRAGVLQYITCDPVVVEKILRFEGKYPERMEVPLWSETRTAENMSLGIVLSKGDNWFKMRRAVNKVFLNPSKINQTLPIIVNATEQLLTLIKEEQENKGYVNFSLWMPKWTLESTGNVLFDNTFGALSPVPPQRTLDFIKAVRDFMVYSNKLVMYPPVIARTFFYPNYRKFRNALRMIHQISLQSVEAKLKQIEDGGSIDDDDVKGTLADILKYSKSKDNYLENHDMFGMVTELFGASVDTTTNTLLFLLYELAKQPALQEKLYEEIKSVLPPDGALTPSALQDASLLKGCVKETLRLYPIIFLNSRKLCEDVELNGTTYEKNSMVFCSLYTMGRDKEIYQNPESFLPERWLRDKGGERKAATNPFASIPFGFGARSCVGRRFAELEMHTLLFMLMKDYRIILTENEPLEPISQTVLMPKRDVCLKIVPRN